MKKGIFTGLMMLAVMAPSSVFASALSQTCNPSVECSSSSQDPYGTPVKCQARINTVADCPAHSPAYNSFNCDSGCYYYSAPVGAPAVCPTTKITVSGTDYYVPTLNVVEYSSAKKLWDCVHSALLDIGPWKDGTTAGDIYYNGGNVGIGTDTPTAKLHISNPTTAEPTLGLGKVTGSPNIKAVGTPFMLIDSSTTGGFAGFNYWSPDNVILGFGGGKTAIGKSSSPRALLDVWGGQQVITGSGLNGTMVLDTIAGYSLIGTNTNTNGIEIDPNGNVGIGLGNTGAPLAPEAQLEVKGDGSGETGIKVYGPQDGIYASGGAGYGVNATGSTAIKGTGSLVGVQGAGQTGGSFSGNTGVYAQGGTVAGVSANIDSAGGTAVAAKNPSGWGVYSEGKKDYFKGVVGIGTTDNYARLNVRVSDVGETAIRAIGGNIGIYASGGQYTGVYAEGGKYGVSANVDSGDGIAVQAKNPSGWGVFSEAVKDYFKGTVGIGTSSPGAQLDVKNSNRGGIGIKGGGTTGGSFLGDLYGVEASGNVGVHGISSNYAFYGDAPTGFSFYGNGKIYNSNAVGIGTTSPAYALDVNGDSIVNWSRTRGQTGWYNETYGGGWYMIDPSWVRTYNARSVWAGGGLIGSDGGLTIGYGGGAPAAGGAVIANNLGVRAAATYGTIVSKSNPNGVPALTLLQSNDDASGWSLQTDINNGNLQFYRLAGGGWGIRATVRQTDGAWLAASDLAFKENVFDLTKYSIDDVMKLKPVTYSMKADKLKTQLIGFIAQDLEKVMPEFVSGKAVSEGGTGLGVNYAGMVTVLTKGMQDQQHEIEALKTQNNDLLKRIEAIEAKLK